MQICFDFSSVKVKYILINLTSLRLEHFPFFESKKSIWKKYNLIFLVPTHYRMTFRFRSFHQCNRKEEEKKWIKDMHQNQDAFGQEASAPPLWDVHKLRWQDEVGKWYRKCQWDAVFLSDNKGIPSPIR